MARVLFVDDDTIEQLFAREILTSRGHHVVCAKDGEEALRIYQSDGLHIDVVVTDLAMPRLNGLRLIKALVEFDSQVIIIAASGSNADQLDLAQDAGVAAIVYKPWDPARFLAVLDALVSKQQATRQWTSDWPPRQVGA